MGWLVGLHRHHHHQKVVKLDVNFKKDFRVLGVTPGGGGFGLMNLGFFAFLDSQCHKT